MSLQVGAGGALVERGQEVGTFEVVRVQSARRVRVRACCREETFELPAVLAKDRRARGPARWHVAGRAEELHFAN